MYATILLQVSIHTSLQTCDEWREGQRIDFFAKLIVISLGAWDNDIFYEMSSSYISLCCPPASEVPTYLKGQVPVFQIKCPSQYCVQ